MAHQGVTTLQLYEVEQVQALLKELVLNAGVTTSTLEYDTSQEYDEITIDQHKPVPDYKISQRMFCTSCDVVFTSRDDQVDHFQSDWHRFNIKQKLSGKSAISADTFEQINDDISSISGSGTEDSEDSDSNQGSSTEPKDDSSYRTDQNHRNVKVYFKHRDGGLVTIYRCVVCNKQDDDANEEILRNTLCSLTEDMKWALFLVGGGHFAGAVFDKNKALCHKTFHRYVVRAKRGTAQSQHDKKGGMANSAGASLRRHNEMALTQNIQDLIKSWSDELECCSRIFIRAAGFNRRIFFGGKSPVFNKSDCRVRFIPLPTRRPTYKELLRVHKILTTVQYIDPAVLQRKEPEKEIVQKHLADVDAAEEIRNNKTLEPDTGETDESSSESGADNLEVVTEVIDTTELNPFQFTKRKKKYRRESKKPNRVFADPTPTDTTSSIVVAGQSTTVVDQLYTACKTSDNRLLEKTLRELAAETDSRQALVTSKENDVISLETTTDSKLTAILNQPITSDQDTLLHIAARYGSAACVQQLMIYGADPSLRNTRNQTAYMAATEKETRNEFRRFMAAFPDRYNYVEAQIPGPLTEDMEKDRKAKALERKKLQKKAKKERLKEQKEVEEKEAEENRKREHFLSLTDRDKRAFLAEQRFAVQQQKEGKSIHLRCWQCAKDITGQVPFEYYDFKFCSTQCLKTHKQSVK